MTLEQEVLRPWELFDGKILPFLSLEQVYEDLAGLRRDGRFWQAQCPVHSGEAGGFSIDPERLEWNCFLGCGGGGPVQYLQKFRGLGWPDAALELALDAGLEADILEPWCQKWRTRDFDLHAQLEARSSLLRLVAVFTRGMLRSQAGQTLRSCLVGQLGFPEPGLAGLELGLYTAPEDLWLHLKKSGRGQEARSWGLFEPHWTGRLVCPWKDGQGRVLNLWGWLPREKPRGRSRRDGCVLFGDRDPLGSLAVPFHLDSAARRGARELLLVENPMKALFLRAHGLEDPFPVASGGEVTGAQVAALERYLRMEGSLTLCFDYHPGTHGSNRDRTARAVKRLRKTRLPVYVVDLAWAADGTVRERWGVEDLIRREEGWERGGAALRALLARREAENVLEADLAGVEGHSMPGVLDIFRGFSSAREEERGGLEPLFRVAEEVGRRLAAGFMKAVPARLLGGAGPAAAGLPPSGPPPALQAAPPQSFSVARMEEQSRASHRDRTSPWASLNEMGVRFSPGEFAVIAARTGHGKTAFVLSLLEHWLSRPGEGQYLFCSREEPEVRICHRLLSLLTAGAGSGWSANQVADFLRRENGGDGELRVQVLNCCRDKLKSWESRLQVVYQPSWQVPELAAYARTLFEGRIPGAILIDHLRLPSAELTHGLKLLSVELGCPVVATVQIEEAAAADGTASQRRPRLEHLREGRVEQEADLVLGLLNCDADSGTWGDPGAATPFQVGVLKNRYGSNGGWADLRFVGRFGRLEVSSPEHPDPVRKQYRPESRKRRAASDPAREPSLFDSSAP